MEVIAVLGVAIAVVSLLAAWSVASTSRAARLHEDRRRVSGIEGTAVVVELEEERPPFGEPVTEWFLVLEVTLSDGERFRVRKYCHTVGAREPKVGDQLTVRAHPDRRRDIELVSVPFEG
jgi:hypothetical protein